MNITESDFKHMSSAERDVILFKNTDNILKRQQKIELHQKIQYVTLTGIITVVGFLAVHVLR